MKIVIQVCIIGLFVMTVAFTGHAADFKYTYGQVAYEDADLTVGSVSSDGDGFSMKGAYEVPGDVFVTASYSLWDLDPGVDVDIWALGAGYHTSLRDGTDLVIHGDFGRVKLSGVSSFGIDTWSADVGVRHRLSDEFEVGGTIGLVKYERRDSVTEYGVQALYHFNESIAAVLSGEFNEDGDTVSLGARYHF